MSAYSFHIYPLQPTICEMCGKPWLILDKNRYVCAEAQVKTVADSARVEQDFPLNAVHRRGQCCHGRVFIPGTKKAGFYED